MRRLLAAAPGTASSTPKTPAPSCASSRPTSPSPTGAGRLTGTARMQERPIAVLVDALRQAGARISYLNNEGYPPLELAGFAAAPATAEPTALSVRGDISSQYISALLMVGPRLPGGLRLTLTGHIGSRPYINMTVALMQLFGADCTAQGDTLTVQPGAYRPTDYTVESDWSAASYWYAMVALAPAGSEITLPGLRQHLAAGRPGHCWP